MHNPPLVYMYDTVGLGERYSHPGCPPRGELTHQPPVSGIHHNQDPSDWISWEFPANSCKYSRILNLFLASQKETP